MCCCMLCALCIKASSDVLSGRYTALGPLFARHKVVKPFTFNSCKGKTQQDLCDPSPWLRPWRLGQLLYIDAPKIGSCSIPSSMGSQSPQMHLALTYRVDLKHTYTAINRPLVSCLVRLPSPQHACNWYNQEHHLSHRSKGIYILSGCP